MAQVEKVIDCYRAVAQFPTLLSARILSKLGSHSSTTIVSSWSQRNLEVGKLVKFQQFHFIGQKGETSNLLPIDTSQELLSSVSNSETYKAVLREVSGESSSKKQCLEIWKHSYLWKNIDLNALEVHGDVYCDADFGAFEWSPCEKKLLYVAEKKQKKTESFYKRKAQEMMTDTKPDDKPNNKKPTKGDEYVFRQDWGEQLLGKTEPVVAVCNTETEFITILDSVPAHFSPGQVVWAPDGKGVVGVVWKNEPRKLGLVHCSNRNSYIFHISEDGKFEVLSEEGKAVRSPRFSPDGKQLVWLEREAGGPHHAAHRLVCCLWSTSSKQKKVLVDIVHDTLKIQGNVPFHGLYNLSLPKRCWRGNSQEVILSTPQKYSVISYVINVVSGNIMALECDDGSTTVLDVWNDMIVCSKSSFNQPSQLVLGHLLSEGNGDVHWVPVTNASKPSLLDGINYHFIPLMQEEIDVTCKSFTAMFIGPKTPESRGVPLVVCPHGGPHGASLNVFSMQGAVFALLGFGVLLVNYRGSIGAGQQSVDFLPGRVGDSDVRDVRLAIKETLKKFSFLDADKVVLFGWSHGGFLVTHLSGQYPTEYKAVVAGNPVTDIVGMFSVTDIPDWTCVESGFQYDLSWNMSAEAFEKMKKCSPVNFVDNVVAPTLLLIGKKDARVPGSQGIQFYYRLKTRNVKARLLLYDDNHSLQQVPIEMDNFVNTVLWLFEHL